MSLCLHLSLLANVWSDLQLSGQSRNFCDHCGMLQSWFGIVQLYNHCLKSRLKLIASEYNLEAPMVYRQSDLASGAFPAGRQTSSEPLVAKLL